MTPNDSVSASPADASSLRLPIIEEVAQVRTEVVETGRVVLRKTVQQETQTVDVPTSEEQVHVERVAVNRVVDAAPAVRQEGDTLIIPVLREETVVTTRLVLVEELHVRKQTLTTHQAQEVTLRREHVHYERVAGAPSVPPTDA